MTVQDVSELAAGATELRVGLKKGDISARSGGTGGWTLTWSSPDGDAPEVVREGAALVVRQRADAPPWSKRLDIEIGLPPGVEAMDLSTGWGRVLAEGLEGRTHLSSGNGGLEVRGGNGRLEAATGNGEVAVRQYEGELSTSTGNGRTRIEGVRGQARLNTGNGRVEILSCDGKLTGSTGNGDLFLSNVGGEAELNTGHGQVEVLSSGGLRLRATTALGGIRVEGGELRGSELSTMMGTVTCSAVLLAGRYTLSSAMGDLSLDLPPDASARVDAQTSFGQVHSDFPLVRVGRSGPMGFGGVRMVGSIGEGEPDLEIGLRSGKGQLHLRRSDGPARGGEWGPGATDVSWESVAAAAREGVAAARAGVAGAREGVAAARAAAAAWPSGFQAPARSGDAPGTADDNATGRGTPGSGDAGPAERQTLSVLEAVARGELSPDEAERLLGRMGQR